ncbi:hypothetical protein RJ55_02514 [Drechmeria coniospora]|nr:hypothetical protein RJ55_02514 [Drechmeria coniospora]
MAAMELIVVVLNHTNEELSLDAQSPQLEQGEWMTDSAESQPPQEIRAGESGMWRCKARHVGAGIAGSAQYRIVGYGANDLVTLNWDVPVVGANKFEHSSETAEFGVEVLGGSGRQAVAVFVFAPAKPAKD